MVALPRGNPALLMSDFKRMILTGSNLDAIEPVPDSSSPELHPQAEALPPDRSSPMDEGGNSSSLAKDFIERMSHGLLEKSEGINQAGFTDGVRPHQERRIIE